MTLDLSIAPAVLLAMWAGGLCLAMAVVSWWKIVGPGFFWTGSGTALLIGAFSTSLGTAARVAVAAVVVGGVAARWWRPVTISALGVAGVAFLLAAGLESNPVLVVTGAASLGGTTAEMLLGHWFLVDPTLPRWSLRALDMSGVAGLVADFVVVAVLGALATGGFVVVAYVMLAALSILMMVGVWFSLGEKGYEGVMAATGLSYLSVLTALGAVALGRFLLG